MATTAKGFPYPAAGAANNVPADLQALADAVDAMPGVTAMSTATRDALSGTTRWSGRVIYNQTTNRHQTWNGTAWQDVTVSDTPTGSVTAYAGASAPSGWLLCDGNVVSRTTYAGLFAVVGTTYGAGDGSTTFALPNLLGRMPVGRDTGQTEFDTLGEAGGSKTSTAPHTHDIDHDHGATSAVSDGAHAHTLTGGVASYNGVNQTIGIDTVNFTNYLSALPNTDPTGGHNHSVDIPALGATASGPSSAAAASGNLQPYLTLNYIIKA